MARPISISKWERGEAPVPVHHWLELIRLLGIPRDIFVEAARKDGHRQLSMFSKLSRSARDSAEEIGSFSWDFIVKTLCPESADKIEGLRAKYKDLTPLEFAQAACGYFVEVAERGLDRNNRPIVTDLEIVSAPSPTDGPRDKAKRAPHSRHRPAHTR